MLLSKAKEERLRLARMATFILVGEARDSSKMRKELPEEHIIECTTDITITSITDITTTSTIDITTTNLCIREQKRL